MPKTIKHSIRKSKKQGNNHFGFSTLAANERRRITALGGVWFESGKEDELKEYAIKARR
jgi:hypothetical protein